MRSAIDTKITVACEVAMASACNFLTAGHYIPALELAGNESTLEARLEWELFCCREQGALDAGSHILAVARKPRSAEDAYCTFIPAPCKSAVR